MKSLSRERVTLWISDDKWEEIYGGIKACNAYTTLNLAATAKETEEEFWENTDHLFSLYDKVVANARAHALSIGLPHIAVLHAHGGTLNGEWIFFDGAEMHKIEEWVNEHDGKSGILFLCACNEENLLPPQTETSFIIFPDDSFSKNVPTIFHGMTPEELRREPVRRVIGLILHTEESIAARRKRRKEELEEVQKRNSFLRVARSLQSVLKSDAPTVIVENSLDLFLRRGESLFGESFHANNEVAPLLLSAKKLLEERKAQEKNWTEEETKTSNSTPELIELV